MTRKEAIHVIQSNRPTSGYTMLCEALDMAIASFREQEERQWIPVTERLPDENNRWVLCLCVSGSMEVLKFDYTMWNWDAQYPGRCYMENYVTHWMPMPEPPKEGDEG